MERVYKTMKVTGAGCIAAGVVILVTGLVVGIISIVNGALLLKRKSEIEFQDAGSQMIRNTTKRQKMGWVLFIICIKSCLDLIIDHYLTVAFLVV